jgi:UDP-glucose 4-epimerase
MKKVLVTGGAGYIGSHTVVELINAGYEPIIIDNLSNSEEFIIEKIEQITGKKVSFYKLDCGDNSSYQTIAEKEGKIDGVIHFAAYKAVGESVEQPLKYYNNNLGSLITLLQNMSTLNCSKIVFSSSCTVYGQPDKLPVTENSPIKNAESPYGITKQMGEEILKTSSGKTFRSIVLRYFNPIGAHPSSLIGELPKGVPNNLIPYITQTGIGIREKLSVFGDDYNTADGTCIRDYIHVIDLALAHIKALEHMDTHPDKEIDFFNIGTGKGTSVLEIINYYNDVSQTELPYIIAPRRQGDIEQIWAETQKAKDVLLWESKFSVKEALKSAWDWQQQLKN